MLYLFYWQITWFIVCVVFPTLEPEWRVHTERVWAYVCFIDSCFIIHIYFHTMFPLTNIHLVTVNGQTWLPVLAPCPCQTLHTGERHRCSDSGPVSTATASTGQKLDSFIMWCKTRGGHVKALWWATSSIHFVVKLKSFSRSKIITPVCAQITALKGQFTPKSKIHIPPLTCSAVYQSR